MSWGSAIRVDIKPELRLTGARGWTAKGPRRWFTSRRLFEGRAWYDLVPDQDHSVVTAGTGRSGKTTGRPAATM